MTEPRLTDEQVAQVKALADLLIEGAYARNKQGTLAQFIAVLLACRKDGISAVEIAKALDQNESSVSRTLKRVGPEGTGCIRMEGRVVYPSEVVVDEIRRLFPESEDKQL